MANNQYGFIATVSINFRDKKTFQKYLDRYQCENATELAETFMNTEDDEWYRSGYGITVKEVKKNDN